MSYIKNLSATIPAGQIATKNDLSYLSAATAVALAGRPNFNFIDFPTADGKKLPYLAMLGGALVGVEVEQSPGQFQTVYLPVMDRDNNAMELASITVTDVNNSRQRCLVKAIAAVQGVGMSLFLGCNGDGPKAAKLLKVEPTSDLADVEAVVANLKDGGAPYVEWTYGLAAARTVDDQFSWQVGMVDGLPYREVLGSLQVELTTTFKGKALTLALPVMDAAFNPIPIKKATVFDWNKTMMRALTKCIAFNSGYGLSIYGDETEAKAEAVARGGRSPRNAKNAANKDAANEASKDAGKDQADAAKSAAAAESTPTAEKAPESSVPAATPAKQEPSAESSAPAPATAEAQPAEAPVQAEGEATQAAKDAPAPEAVTEKAAADAPTAPVVDEATQAAVEKFKNVMNNRREKNGIDGLLSLFQALSVSTVFAEQHKPDCFQTLVLGVIFDINAKAKADAEAAYAFVPPLFLNISDYNVAQMFNPDSRHLISLRLVALAIQAAVAKNDDSALTAACDDLIKAGIAEDLSHVFNLTQEADLSAETKDLLAAVLDSQTA